MSAPGNDENGGSLSATRRRIALAQAARANATREEIEARGIRPDVQQIVHHMNNRTPSHSFKRTKLGHSTAHRIYDDDEDGDDDTEAEEEDDEDEFEEQWQGILAEEGLQDANMFVLAEFRQIARQRLRMLKKTTSQWHSMCRPPKKDRFDLLASLCTCTELIVEVGKHLRPLDIVHLYSISKDFHATIDTHMRSSIFAWVSNMAPTAARIYSSPVYCRWFIPDPDQRRVTPADQELSRTQPGQAKIDGQPPLNANEGEVRLIPGLLWLQMVVNREIRVRDIIACLARRGHRLPEGAHLTLKKIWLIMDAATTQARMMLLNNPDFFSNEDLYIAQLFMIKLVLAFNDPVFGPQSAMLMRLVLGQRSLSPLWAMLRGKKYRTIAEIRHLKLRYDVGAEQILNRNLPLPQDVPADQLGVVHFEGWGTGPDHLMRPDELIPLESARRQLELDSCIEEMMIYGHVDFNTGNSLVPSLDEMYMSDDDLSPAHKGWKPFKRELIHSGCGNIPFEPGMWRPKHARKARWNTLTEEEKAMILEEEQEEMDEVKELDGALRKFDGAWANLAKLTSQTMSAKKLKAKYEVLAPSVADMEDQLAQFAQPRRLRLASNYTDPYSDSDPDAMEIDNPSPSANTFSNLTIRTAQQQQQHHSAPDPDDLSTIPDDDLALDPIPTSEVNRIFHSFRPSHRPQSESETDSNDVYYEEEDDDDDDDDEQDHHPNPQPNSYTHPHLQPHPEEQPPPSLAATLAAAAAAGNGNDTSTDDETTSEYSDDQDEEDEHELPPPQIYHVHPTLVHTTATALSENTDEMLLAQADLEYSDVEYGYEEGDGEGEEGEGEESGGGSGSESGGEDGQDRGDGGDGMAVRRELDGEGGQQQQLGDDNGGDAVMGDIIPVNQTDEVAGVGGMFGVDWDDFLRNPAAYAVEGEEPVYAHAQGSEVDDDETEIEDEDGEDEEDMEMEDDEDGLEEDEGVDENDDINLLMGGLQVGGQGQAAQDGYQQVAQEMAEAEGDDEINLEEYVADEDAGEDDRTRKLRDWFRPW